jgi:hypothetical protein
MANIHHTSPSGLRLGGMNAASLLAGFTRILAFVVVTLGVACDKTAPAAGPPSPPPPAVGVATVALREVTVTWGPRRPCRLAMARLTDAPCHGFT